MSNYLNPNEATVGMPATYCIGSDRYATAVTEIFHFKTGAKAGQVKAILAGTRMFTLRTKGRKAGYLVREGGDYGVLHLGWAEDYRDPHF